MTDGSKKLSAQLRRRRARLAAVQALYQMDLAQTNLEDVISEFSEFRLNQDTEEEPVQADEAFFKDLLVGVVRAQRGIDPIIDARLAEGWHLVRIDSILRAILRSAAYELMHRDDVPAKVVISEYIDVAHAFFEGDEPRVVNGVLDNLARNARTGELHESPEG